MRKKVGIMSMQRIINYGSYLQAYALSNTIKNLGHDVEFVDFKIEPCIVNPFTRINLEDIEDEYKEGYYLTQDFIKKFKDEFLHDLGIKNRNERPKLDTLVIGSDEVFNCLQSNPDVGYSLELYGQNHNAEKIITYAASCGHTTYERLLKFNKQDEISNLLNKFNNISVRDKNSLDFVKKLSDKNPIEHLDPVLIYDFSNTIRDVNLKDYIIVYAYNFNLSNDECKEIRKFAKKINKKIVTIGSYQKCTDIFIDAHPLDVMSYFKKADFVITNTFHGTIFSIKTHTPFVTKIVQNINSEKLSDLLNKLSFNDRNISSFDNLEEKYNAKVDFSKIDKKLKEEKIRSIEYLENNI